MHSNLEKAKFKSFVNLCGQGRNNTVLVGEAVTYTFPKILRFALLAASLFLVSSLSSYSQTLKFTCKIFLEGPFDESTGRMVARLRLDSLVSTGRIPQATVFLPAPSQSTHNYNAVDAVRLFLVRSDLRRVDSVSAWVAEDGNLYEVNTGLTKTIGFTNAPEGSYYLEVKHRNHLAVMYATVASFRASGTINFDFTKLSNIYKQGAIMVGPTTCAMIAGNAVSDGLGEVNAKDLYEVSKDSDNLKQGYLQTDVDLSGVVNALDRQLTLENNLKLYHSKVP